MKLIRIILGAIILFLDWITTPRGIKRTPELQKEVDDKTAKLALYHFKSCPFCVKVRREIKRNSLNITMHDVKRDEQRREELLEGGGRVKVPCLRIENESGDVQWMYESSDIVDYLQKQFS